MVVDTSEGEQSYVEDCEVCCRPLLIRYCVDSEEGREKLISFIAEPS